MSSYQTGIIDPPIDELLKKVDSKYALVIFASQRARQINDYYSEKDKPELLNHIGPMVDVAEGEKPLSIALHEIVEDKLEMRARS